jgi:hypothetical protein
MSHYSINHALKIIIKKTIMLIRKIHAIAYVQKKKKCEAANKNKIND